MPPAPRWQIWGGVALLILIWGTTWAVIRIGLAGVPPFTGAALRFALAAAVLAALAALRQAPLRPRCHPWKLWLANGLLTFAAAYGVVYWAEQWVPSGLAAVLFATYPLWVTVLAHRLLVHEPLRPARLAGVLTGFAGVAVIFSEDLPALAGPGVVTAATVFLAAPVASALGSVLVKRWGAGAHPLSLTAAPMALAAVVLGAVAAALERGQTVRFDPVSVAALLYLSLLGSAATFVVYFWLLDRLPATRLALITYAIPVVAVLVGAGGMGERVTARIVAGGLLVLAGVALAGRARAA